MKNISNGGSECFDFEDVVLVKYTCSTQYLKKGDVLIYGPKFGNMDYSTYTMEICCYWVEYTDVTINKDGYIEIVAKKYSETNGKIQEIASTKLIVNDDSTYNMYYTSRGKETLS